MTAVAGVRNIFAHYSVTAHRDPKDLDPSPRPWGVNLPRFFVRNQKAKVGIMPFPSHRSDIIRHSMSDFIWQISEMIWTLKPNLPGATLSPPYAAMQKKSWLDVGGPTQGASSSAQVHSTSSRTGLVANLRRARQVWIVRPLSLPP